MSIRATSCNPVDARHVLLVSRGAPRIIFPGGRTVRTPRIVPRDYFGQGVSSKHVLVKSRVDIEYRTWR